MRRRRWAGWLGVGLLALGLHAAPAEAPKSYAAGKLHTLERLEDFQALFNKEQGRARVVLLLSPT